MSGHCSFNADKVAALVRELLREDRPNGGWFIPADVARECGVSRATVYRWLAKLETAGWPLERDADNCGHRKYSLGVRSLLVAKPRPVDTQAHLRRVA